MEMHEAPPGKMIPLMAVNVGTLVVGVAWLVAAGYALLYLLSH